MSDVSRVGRTVRLTADVNDRLNALCEHIGTNPNSYLVNAIGKAIAQDEIALNVKKHQAEASQQLLDFLREMAGNGPHT